MTIRSIGLALAGLVGAASLAHAADDALIAAAKKEGAVTIYTSLVINQVAQPLADAFGKKYGIKATPVRADTNELIRRVIDEAKAGRPQCDVFDGTTTVPALKRENLVLKWLPETAKNLPEVKDENGYWAALYVLASEPGVNSELVPAGQEPKTWDDLLDPKWKGKMVWSSGTNTGGIGFVGMALREWGEDKGMAFLRRLAEQKIASVPTSTRQVLDQVIAGEYAIGPMSSVHHVMYSADQGAPVRWRPVEPAVVSLITASVAANAPHPNAAKLYFDFVLSDEGQTIFRDNYYLTSNLNVPPKNPKALPQPGNYRGQFFTPEQVDAETPKWVKVFQELFR